MSADRPADPTEPADDGPDGSAGRRPWIIAAVGLAVLLVVGAIVYVAVRDDVDESADDAATTTVEPASDASTPDDPAPETTDAGGGLDEVAQPDPNDPDEPTPPDEPSPEALLPIGAIAPGPEAETCAAIVERLRTYRDVADETGTSELGQLFDGMTEFEAEIFTLAENQDWGDRIIEQLVDVRRNWADARALAASGDTQAAAKAASTALDLLDETISTSDCPS